MDIEPAMEIQIDVVLWPNPILSQKARPVEVFSENLKILADQMTDTMKKANGEGLAAPQVGVPFRVFVMRERQSGDVLVVCNPSLKVSGMWVPRIEGCLSLPGARNQVLRQQEVNMKYQDLAGVWREVVMEGLEACVAQHEEDHLNGIMIFDHMSRQMRRATLQQYEKWLKRS